MRGFKMETSVAFRIGAGEFVAFAEALASCELDASRGQRLERDSVVDHDLCYAYYFQNPYGNGLELDCYEYEKVKKDLIEEYAVTPVRFW